MRVSIKTMIIAIAVVIAMSFGICLLGTSSVQAAETGGAASMTAPVSTSHLLSFHGKGGSSLQKLPEFALSQKPHIVAKADYSSKRVVFDKSDGAANIDLGAFIADAQGQVVADGHDAVVALFPDETSARDAVDGYEDIGGTAAADECLVLSDERLVVPAAEEAPLGILNMQDEFQHQHPGAIAVIDTGAAGANVSASYSVLDGEGSNDSNGHGTTVAAAISAANENAEIVSIKAFDADGHGSVSSIYAAIEMASDMGVSVINCSFTAYMPEGNEVIEKAIADAQAKGIVVVAAAGNYGMDAGYFVPAGTDGVVTAGIEGISVDEKGVEHQNVDLDFNFGDAVECYLMEPSTSIAAAKLSGYIAGGKDVNAVIDEGLGFYHVVGAGQWVAVDKNGKPTPQEDIFAIQAGAEAGHSNGYSTTGGSCFYACVTFDKTGEYAGGHVLRCDTRLVIAYGDFRTWAGGCTYGYCSWVNGEIWFEDAGEYYWNTQWNIKCGYGSSVNRSAWAGYEAWNGDWMGSDAWCKYSPPAVKVTFNANFPTPNGGTSGASSSSTVINVGSAIGSRLPSVSAVGYDFLGWYSGNTQYTSSSTVTSPLTLTGRWQNHTYTVTWNPNGGNAPSSRTTGVKYRASVGSGGIPSVTRRGYEFAGWWTAASGGSQISSSTVYTWTSNVTFYAHWTPHSVTVNFYRNVPSDNTNAPLTCTYDSFNGKLQTRWWGDQVSRTGYRQIGWDTNRNVTSNPQLVVYKADSANSRYWKTGSNITPTNLDTLAEWNDWIEGIWNNGRSRSYYAIYNPIVFRAWFNANGGNGSMEMQAIAYDNPQAIRDCTFTRVGYTFGGWSMPNSAGKGTTDGTGTHLANKQSWFPPAYDLTLYAKWMLRTYTISYDLDGGKLLVMPTTYTVNDTFAIKAPVKTGYTFQYWTGTGLSGLNTQSFTVSRGSTGPRSYTAHFAPNSYTVKFDANGGSGTMADQTMVYDSNATLSKNIFTRTGYKFVGWNTRADGAGVPYDDEATVRNLSASASVTLYAQWEGEPRTVTFVGEDGIVIKTESVRYGSAATAPETNRIPTKPGMRFDHWDKDFSCITSDLTVNAVYAVVYNEVKFLDWDGSVLKSEQVEYGKGATAPEDPTWDGHSFRGWDKTFSVIYSPTVVNAQYDLSDFLISYKIRESDIDGGSLKWPITTVHNGEAIGINRIPPLTLADGWALEGYVFAGTLYETEQGLAEAIPTSSSQIEVRIYPDIIGASPDHSNLNTPNGVDDRLEYVISYQCFEQSASPVWNQTVARTDKPVGYNNIPEMNMRPGWLVDSYTVDGVRYTPSEFMNAKFSNDILVTIGVHPDALGNSNLTHPEDLENNITTPDGIDDRYQAVVSFMSQGRVYNQQVVRIGGNAICPVNPSMTGYTFLGWNGDVNNIQGATNIYADWEISTYLVTFIADDVTIATREVGYGQNVTDIPAAPIKQYYDFIGWGDGVRNVTSNRNVYAQYARAQRTLNFTVRSGDEDGIWLDYYSTSIDQGLPIPDTKVPPVHLADGWVFDGYYLDGNKVRNDLGDVGTEYNVTLELRAYPDKIGSSPDRNTANVPDGIDDRTQVVVGYSAEANDDIAVEYAFAVIARGKIGEENVPGFALGENWKLGAVIDADGNRLPYDSVKDVDVQSDTSFVFTAFPDVKGNSKPNDISSPDNRIHVSDGVDDREQVVVTFKDEDGSVVNQQVIAINSAATPPEMQDRGSMAFAGWDSDISRVGTDTVVTAVYRLKTVVVTFKGYDGTVLSVQEINYGDTATPPVPPTREGYTFSGWDKPYNDVEEDTVVTAIYNRDSTTLVFYVRAGDEEGLSLPDSSKEVSVPLGGLLNIDKVPVPEVAPGWVFDGYYIGEQRYTAETLSQQAFYTATAIELRGYPDALNGEADGIDDRQELVVEYEAGSTNLLLSFDRATVLRNEPLGSSRIPDVTVEDGFVIDGFYEVSDSAMEPCALGTEELSAEYLSNDTKYVIRAVPEAEKQPSFEHAQPEGTGISGTASDVAGGDSGALSALGQQPSAAHSGDDGTAIALSGQKVSSDAPAVSKTADGAGIALVAIGLLAAAAAVLLLVKRRSKR